MLKTLVLALFATFAIGMLAACDTTAPGAAPAMTFNDKAAVAEQLVQTVQKTATAALRAGRINVQDDQRIQAGVDVLHNAIVSAKALQASNPTAAAAAIDQAVADLRNLQVQIPGAPPSPPANTPTTSKVPA